MVHRSRSDRPDRRGELLDAATRVFHTKGFDAASIQDVADELGILKGSLYHYIDTKEDLLFSIIEEVHHATMQQLEDWLALEGLTTLQRLRALLTLQVLSYCRDTARIGIFLRDFRALSPQRQQQINTERDRYDRVLRDLIRTGQQEGSIDATIDPKLAAMAVFGMLNWIVTWWDPAGPNTPEQVAQQFTDLVIAGLVPREPDGERSDLAPLPASFAPYLHAPPG